MTELTAKNTVISFTLSQEHLSIIFEKEWYQEDITSLTEQLLSPIEPLTIQEKNIGADRENIRFSWQAHFFVLNFDVYSQSCWFEGQDSTSTEYLTNLHSAMSRELSK